MELEDLRFCARYPFTKEAKGYLDFLKLDLDGLDDDLLEYSSKRVTDSLSDVHKYVREKFEQIKLAREPYLMKEIVSFPVSKVLVALTEDMLVKKKFARAESQRAYHFLQFEDDKTLEGIAKQLFTFKKDGKAFLIKFNEYLTYPAEDKDYSLVNLELDEGMIKLDKEKLAKLISQYVYHTTLRTKVDKRDIKNKMFFFFTEELKKDKRYVVPEELGAVEMEAFPPCMRKIYRDLQSEDKVGHIPRFVFSTFLGGIKMPIEEAIALFKEQANFNEGKTRYYLEHSYGLKSNRTKYSVPACAKMESYGICYKDNTCRWKHPMTYYAKMKRYKK